MQKGTSFRIYAQKNPLEEFKNESYKMFNFLIRQIFIDISNAITSFNPVDFIDKIEDNSQNILRYESLSMNASNLYYNNFIGFTRNNDPIIKGSTIYSEELDKNVIVISKVNKDFILVTEALGNKKTHTILLDFIYIKQE